MNSGYTFPSILAIIAFILLQSASSIEASDTSIHGKIIDKTSRNPIKNVNVSLANTSIGTTTDSKGYFEITQLPQGTFEIIFSHVSYYFRAEKCLLKREYNDLGIIELSQKVHQLETVIVEAEEANLWNERYEVFTEQFIGENENADSTFILDPYKIDFWELDGKLYASCLDPIKIVNRSLGYNITYFLEYFESTSGYTKFSGNSVFTQIITENIWDSIRWNRNRKHTYLGSIRHFLSDLNSCYSKFLQLSNSGIERIESENSETIHRSLSNRTSYKVTYANKIDSLSSRADELLNDKGFFLYRVFALPWDSPAPISDEPISMIGLLSKGEINTERYLHIDKYLRVYFIPNYKKEDYSYNFVIRKVKGVQSSFIQLENDSVMIDVNGRYYDKFGIHTFGNFGNERIADMLPYEYKIEID